MLFLFWEVFFSIFCLFVLCLFCCCCSVCFIFTSCRQVCFYLSFYFLQTYRIAPELEGMIPLYALHGAAQLRMCSVHLCTVTTTTEYQQHSWLKICVTVRLLRTQLQELNVSSEYCLTASLLLRSINKDNFNLL